MRLAVQGHPLHTRSLSITLQRGAGGKLEVLGELVDLRKRGFVPVAGDLQTSGVVHHMRIRAVVDSTTALIESIAAEQPAVAFEASAVSGGESCRDPIDRLQAMRGATLDGEFAKRLAGAIGGPRGCSHVLTLGQLLGSAGARAILLERESEKHAPPRREGERIFRRDVIIDGNEVEEGLLHVAVQLADLHFAPAAAVARPMERFGSQYELRLLAETRAYGFVLDRVEGAERRRSHADVESAEWNDRAARLAELVGLPLLSGFNSELLARFGALADDRPLLDSLLMIGPALIQIIAALSEGWPAEAKRASSLMGTGGMPDSCYMWRREGALSQRLKEEIKAGSLQPRRERSY